MEYEKWSDVFGTVNADNNLNESNVIEKIKEKLKGEDEGEYEEWEKADFDVSHQFKDGSTLLHWATKMRNKEVAELLIKKGANPNLQNNNTPLHCAVERNDKGLVEVLLKAEGFDLNAQSRDGSPLLHWACAIAQSNKDLVEVLLKAEGINVNEQSENGDTPLHYAVGGYHGDVLEALIKEGANVNVKNKDGKTPLYLACSTRYYNEDVVKALLQNSAEVDATIPLNGVVRYGSIDIMKDLIDKGADPLLENKDGKTLVDLVIESYKNCPNIGEFLLSWAKEKNLTDIVNALTEKRANFKTECGYLHSYVQFGRTDEVKALIKEGADVNVNIDGNTPLHLAVIYVREDIVNFLLDNGAGVNAVNRDGNTPLHLAAEYGDIDIVKALLDKWAQVNAVNGDDDTPLHLAVKYSYIDVIKALLDKGAQVNAVNGDDDTPLHLAVKRPHMDGINTLLKVKGINVHIKNKDGNTFLDSAERYVIEVRNKQIDRGVTFYDILASEGNKLASYMQNESIARVLKTGNYKKEFPLWANIIESQYEKGMERRILLDKTAEAMGIQHPDLETIPELPLPVGDKIASFLANVDLENFCKSANQRSC